LGAGRRPALPSGTSPNRNDRAALARGQAANLRNSQLEHALVAAILYGIPGRTIPVV
jgi:hypothetical protein